MYPSSIDFRAEDIGPLISSSMDFVRESLDGLSAEAAEYRTLSEEPELRTYRRIRVECPFCEAPIYCLTAFSHRGEIVRGCRACRLVFALDV